MQPGNNAYAIKLALAACFFVLWVSEFARPASACQSANSDQVSQVARIIGAWPVLENIESLKKELKGMEPQNPVETLAKRQKFIYLRQKLAQILATANLEVNATRGRIEAEMAQVQQLQATMTEKRARSLRRNTIINVISGGLTKITGYSIALGGNDTPTNILEVFDGSVQCALSGIAMKELHCEHHIAQDLPPLLSSLERGDDSGAVYPEHIWNYLGEPGRTGEGVSRTTSLSRREALCSRWRERGMLARRDRALRLKEGSTHQHLFLARAVPNLLEDRLAMLSEVRSVVSEMHNSLMELSRKVKQSFEDDPSFDWPV